MRRCIWEKRTKNFDWQRRTWGKILLVVLVLYSTVDIGTIAPGLMDIGVAFCTVFVLSFLLPDFYLGERFFFSRRCGFIPLLAARDSIELLKAVRDENRATTMALLQIQRSIPPRRWRPAFIELAEDKLLESEISAILSYLGDSSKRAVITEKSRSPLTVAGLGWLLADILFFSLVIYSLISPTNGITPIFSIRSLLGFAIPEYGIVDPRPTPDANATKVLFLGNSLLGEHNVPLMVSKVAAAEGRSMWFQSHLKGGAIVAEHHKTAGSRPPVGHHWDAVILQPQSLEFLSRSWFGNSTKALNDILTTVGSTGGSTIVMIPWPRLDYPESPKTQLTKQLELASQSVLSPNRIAPTGFAWIRALNQNRMMELYADDGNHAKETGAILTALTLYQAIFRTSECPHKGLTELGSTNEQSQILCSASSEATAYLSTYTQMFPLSTTQDS